MSIQKSRTLVKILTTTLPTRQAYGLQNSKCPCSPPAMPQKSIFPESPILFKDRVYVLKAGSFYLFYFKTNTGISWYCTVYVSFKINRKFQRNFVLVFLCFGSLLTALCHSKLLLGKDLKSLVFEFSP